MWHCQIHIRLRMLCLSSQSLLCAHNCSTEGLDNSSVLLVQCFPSYLLDTRSCDDASQHGLCFFCAMLVQLCSLLLASCIPRLPVRKALGGVQYACVRIHVQLQHKISVLSDLLPVTFTTAQISSHLIHSHIMTNAIQTSC